MNYKLLLCLLCGFVLFTASSLTQRTVDIDSEYHFIFQQSPFEFNFSNEWLDCSSLYPCIRM